MDGVQIIVDQDTYKKLSKIADKKGKSTVDELSKAIGNHIDYETKKDNELKEGKQLLCEG